MRRTWNTSLWFVPLTQRADAIPLFMGIASSRSCKAPIVEQDGTPFAYLKRGDLMPWEISRNRKFYGPEIKPMFESIGLKIELLQEYKDKYCSDRAHPNRGILN